jgi:hypothetical protein
MAGGTTQRVALIHWAEFAPFASPAGTSLAAPLLRVLLEAGSRRRRSLALLDSGSDYSLVPPALARAMGCIPPTYDIEVRSARGAFMAGDVMIRSTLLLDAEIVRLPVAPFLVPEPKVELPFIVLGRDPLFESAEVRFRTWESRVGIAPVRSTRWIGPSPPPRAIPYLGPHGAARKTA